jgi:hypothetical protein
MAQNYIRQSIFIDGDTITASLFNNEYNQLVNVFSYSSTSAENTGHRHDGTTGQGGNIPVIGDIDFKNKIVVDGTNNRWGFFVKVAGTTVEQIRIQDGGIVPVTTNDIDLGTSSLQFKDIFINGTANIDSLVLTSGVTVTTILDEDDLVTNSATALATQQSIKAYVDAQVTAQDLDIVGDTGTDSIDLDSETLTFTGGTGITSVVTAGTVTHNIDSTVTTLTGTQTLTNKTLNGGNIDGTVIGGTTAAAGSFTNLQFDGLNPTVTYDFNGSGTVTSADSLAYIKLGSGISTGVDISATPVVAPSWSAATGTVYADNKFRILAAKGNSTDALTVAGAGSASGYGDTVVIGNVDVNGVDTKLITGLGINGELITLAGNATATGTLAVTGEIAANGGIALGDNDKATFGASDDLQIYHSGAASIIADVGTGNLVLQAGDFRLKNADSTETMILANAGSTVQLYHDNAVKLATTATGIDISGTATMDGLTVDGNASIGTSGTSVLDFERSGANYIRANNSGTGRLHLGAGSDLRFHTGQADNEFTENERMRISSNGDISFYEDTGTTPKLTWSASGEDLNFADNVKATFGAGDLQIYHDGNNSYVSDTGTGGLYLKGSNEIALRNASNGNIFLGLTGGSAYVYHNGSAKLSTTATGIDVTGTATMDGLNLGDSEYILAGAGADLKIGHDGTDNIIRAQNGPLYIDANGTTFRGYSPYTKHMSIANNGDVSFYEDTGTTPKFVWDSSAESLGIGTSSPAQAKLDILLESDYSSHTGHGLSILSNAADAYTSLYIGTDDTIDSAYIQSAGKNTSFTSKKLLLNPNGGNVGIGTAPNAATVLHVQATEPQVLISDASSPLQRFMAFDVGLAADEDTHFITVDQADGLAFGEKLNGNDRD